MKFLCPNDHLITCKDSRAGRVARCPECQVLLQVPQPSEGEMPRAVELMEFLCPNDHRLTAPVSRAGRAGKCPHCGVEFQIPSLEHFSEEPAAEGASEQSGEEHPLGEPLPQEEAAPEAEAPPAEDEGAGEQPPAVSEGPPPFPPPETAGAAPEPAAEEAPVSEEPQLPVPDETDSGPRSDVAEMLQELEQLSELETLEEVPPPPPPPPMHPMARMFETLWNEMDEEAMFEITLEDGHRFVPVAFSEASLQAPLALFASSAGENNNVVVLVPWEKITRVVVRGVKELPKNLFE